MPVLTYASNVYGIAEVGEFGEFGNARRRRREPNLGQATRPQTESELTQNSSIINYTTNGKLIHHKSN